jgi:hypothetical protein
LKPFYDGNHFPSKQTEQIKTDFGNMYKLFLDFCFFGVFIFFEKSLPNAH